MPKTALIAVDVQNDFLPGGSLGVPRGDEIIAPLRELAAECDLVVASRDWHPREHISFRSFSWPEHCIQDTKGAKIHPAIRKLARYTISKGMEPGAEASEAYSAFEGHTLRPVRYLEQILRDNAIDRVIVGGLALDFCVRWTALDANALGLETIVPLDCTRVIERHGMSRTLEAFDRAGVKHTTDWMTAIDL